MAYLDPLTLALAVLQCGGQALVLGYGFFHPGRLPVLFVLSSILMNLSFTVWHECSHRTLSRVPRWNAAIGILSSLFAPYPGYYARVREHLAHHRWEGHPHLDPVFPRIQRSGWAFPFALTRDVLLRRGARIPANFLPLSAPQKNADRLTLLASFSIFAGLALAGRFDLAMAAFVLPRIAVFYLHAYYICWIPHSVQGGGFEKYRLADRGLAWRIITMGQWAHGMHHLLPNLPWHRYSTKETLKLFQERVAQREPSRID